jgi:hypothetical protein
VFEGVEGVPVVLLVVGCGGGTFPPGEESFFPDPHAAAKPTRAQSRVASDLLMRGSYRERVEPTDA